MSIFYVGLNPRYQNYRFLPIGINVMFSAAGFWDPGRRRWRRDHKFMPKAGRRFLDMGGYTALNRWGSYPFTIGAALNLVARLSPDYYAAMDYPCEPGINRADGMSSNRQRIMATVENCRQMIADSPMVPGSVLVPVIQGYTLPEYIECIDRLGAAGCIRDYMAVGSMCRRLSSAELHELIPAIAEYAGRAGCRRLHWFGLKLDPALVDLAPFIFSRDSAAVLDVHDPELRAKRNGRRYPRGQAEKRAAFFAFLDRAESLGLSPVSILPSRNMPADMRRALGADLWAIIDADGTIDPGIHAHIVDEMAIDDLTEFDRRRLLMNDPIAHKKNE